MLTLLARGAISGLPDSEGPVDVAAAAGPDEVTAALADGPPDCAVLDLGAAPELVHATLDLLRGRIPVLAHARDDLTAARFSGPLARTAELVRSPGELRERITWHLSASARDAGTSLDDLVRGATGALGPAPAGPAREDPAPAAGQRGPSALHGKKVLVVDDDPRNVFAITSTLEHYGMTVLGSRDGQAGIEALRGQPDTDLVLMDLMMPGMDGYTAISEIREIPEFSSLPIIAVTAHTMTGELAGGVPGADDCLPKPLDTDELLGRMARCLAS
ncbi:MAG: response regulator [Streptosporangiales bacterium]|nr:response regulator [Streptosporangiales bacterium]